MTIFNREKEYLQFDASMFMAASRDIAQMLSLMGVADGEPFHLRKKAFDRHGLKDVSGIALLYAGEVFVINRYYADGTSACDYQYGCGELLCGIQAGLMNELQKVARETKSIPRQDIKRFRNLLDDYYHVQSETERSAGRDIIQMLIEMDVRDYLTLPEIKQPVQHADSIVKVCYQRGCARSGGMTYDFRGDDYSIVYLYDDDGRINYAEANGIETILGLYHRVARLYRKYKNTEREEAMQRNSSN